MRCLSQTSLEQLNKLPPVLKKEETVTAKNVPGISDAFIASEDPVIKHKFTALTRIMGYPMSGYNPSNMAIGFVPAFNGGKKTRLNLKGMDLMEMN